MVLECLSKCRAAYEGAETNGEVARWVGGAGKGRFSAEDGFAVSNL